MRIDNISTASKHKVSASRNLLHTFFLLSVACLVSTKIQVRTDDLAPFYRYDPASETYTPTGKSLNYSQGTWYWIRDLHVLEFHPDDAGFLLFDTDDNRDYLYLEKDRQVLVFPFITNGKKPYTSQSNKFEYNGETNFDVVFQSSEPKESLAVNINEKMASLVPKEYRGPKIKEWGKVPKYTLLWGVPKVYNEFKNHLGSLLQNEKQFEDFVRGSGKVPGDLLPLIHERWPGKFKEFFFGKMVYFMESNMASPLYYYKFPSEVKFEFGLFRSQYMDSHVARMMRSAKNQGNSLNDLFDSYMSKVLGIGRDMVEDFFFGRGLPVFRSFYKDLKSYSSRNPAKILENRARPYSFCAKTDNDFREQFAIISNSKDGILNPQANGAMQEVEGIIRQMIGITSDYLAEIARTIPKEVCSVNDFVADRKPEYKESLLSMSYGEWVADDLVSVVLPQIMNVYQKAVFSDGLWDWPWLKKIGFETSVKKNNSSYEQFREALMVMGYVDYQECFDKDSSSLEDFKAFSWVKDRVLI